MSSLIYTTVQNVKEQITKNLNISITNIIFILNCFFMWKYEYLSAINLKRYVPTSISDVILDISHLLYDNLLWMIIGIGLFIIIIFIFINKTHVFVIKDIDYDDTAMNPYLAIQRLVNIGLYIMGPVFVYFMSINLILNEKQTINFFLLNTDYLRKSGIGILHCIFFLNILYTAYVVFKSLFTSKKTNLTKFIIYGKHLPLYVEFNGYVEGELDHKYKTMILKEKYTKNPIFYVVKGQITESQIDNENIFNDEHRVSVKIPESRQAFYIIDSSSDLFEMDYLFDKLKNNQKNTI